jgi:hypothetical protein
MLGCTSHLDSNDVYISHLQSDVAHNLTIYPHKYGLSTRLTEDVIVVDSIPWIPEDKANEYEHATREYKNRRTTIRISFDRRLYSRI